MSGVEYITEWPPPPSEGTVQLQASPPSEGTVQLQASPPSEGTSVQPSSSNDDETSGRLKRQYHSSDQDSKYCGLHNTYTYRCVVDPWYNKCTCVCVSMQ